jgi:hypothetical protein
LETADCGPVPSQRAAFAEMLSLLIVCAGNPLLQRVADSATEVQRRLRPGASAVTKQRISGPRFVGAFEPAGWCYGSAAQDDDFGAMLVDEHE